MHYSKKLITLSTFLFLLLASSLSFGEYTVFGEEIFSRSYGEAVKKEIEFQVPSEGNYTLRINNGVDDYLQVRAARIKINGELVIRPYDLHKGYMDHIVFGDDEWAKEKPGKKWGKYWSSSWFKSWDLRESILIDRNISLNKSNTIQVILYGIPKRKASKFQRFVNRFRRFLPKKWYDTIDNGSGLSIEILGSDSELPIITANVNPISNENGWSNQDTTISFNCSDDLSGIYSCSDGSVVQVEGLSMAFTGSAIDNAQNEATVEVIVSLDKTAPNVVANTQPLANEYGWNNSDITISYSCKDDLSGLVSCPPEELISTESNALAVDHQIYDLAGNITNISTVIKLDKAPPIVQRNINNQANEHGWYSSDFTVAYSCFDNLSGLSEESQRNCEARVVSNESSQILDSIDLKDQAGNTIESVESYKLDKTSPEISLNINQSPNADGWFNKPIEISYVCSDNLSGVVNCPEGEVYSDSGRDILISQSVFDFAGNQRSTSKSVNIDTQKPSIQFESITNGALLSDHRPTIDFVLTDNIAVKDSSLKVVVNSINNGAQCTINSTQVECALLNDLEDENLLIVHVTDLAGNISEESVSFSLDLDSDGIANTLDQCPGTEQSATANQHGCSPEQLDKDLDGVANFEDQCPNTLPGVEVENDGCDDSQRDTDKDGVLDINDAFPQDPGEQNDLDGDGIGDNSDTDIDGDGISNDYELVSGTDANNPNSHSADLDSDGVPDQFDADRDGDGFININDLFPDNAEESVDLDGDGIGDNSDTDRDGDGISNDYENQLGTDAGDLNSTPQDLDSDGIPDSLDSDRDGDGVENESDEFPDNIAESSDVDGDGVGDNADLDRDGDGFEDEIEEQLGSDPSDANNQPADMDEDGIADSLDEDMDGDGVVNLQDDYPEDATRSLVPVSIFIDSPVNGYVTTENEVVISGHFSGPITSIRVEDADALITDTYFTAVVDLKEGANKITAVGSFTGLNGIRAANGTKNIILDTTPPEIIISSITEGMVTTSSDITIAGTLDDLRSNLSNAEESIVTINGIVVSVVDKSFELADYNLRPGLNIINVQATDPQGNGKTVQRTVVYLDDAGQKILEIAGNNQSSTVGGILAEDLVVKLVDRSNLPIIGRVVTFKVSEGDGIVIDEPTRSRELHVITDEQGFARASFELGKRSGAGKHQITVSSIGFPGVVIFSASAQSLSPSLISSARGNYQTGMMGSILGEPLVARVTDENGNPVNGVDVKFVVVEGDGAFLDVEGQSAIESVMTTDYDGNVSVDFVLGNDLEKSGQNSQHVLASIVGQDETVTSFAAHNLRPGNVEDTTITGIVLDNSNQPVPNAEVSIKGEFFSIRDVLTDEQGKFIFEQAPVGTVHLVIDGSTATREGEWPHLMFELVTISGQENTVGMPIYIPMVDYDGGKIAGGAEEIIIPMKGVAGAEVIIPPNSMTFPDGRTIGRIMFSQVQTDKVPMPAPNGSTFDLAWTLQPAGVHFDPPVRVSLPNSFGGEPGEEMEMFSFDHDLMEWVGIGPGVVSDDGIKITSRTGHGIRHSGWGGAPPPPDDTCNIRCNSKDECIKKSKVPKICACKSTYLDGKVKSAQKSDDCLILKCGGNEYANSEIPPDATKKGDCQISKCENGGAPIKADDSDKPDPKENADNACKTCSGGDIIEGNEKGKCGDGSTSQSCWTCKEGKCGNQCDAPKETTKETYSIGANIAQYVENIAEKVKELSRNKIEVIVKPEISYEATEGMECCKDCSVESGEPVKYTDHSGAASLEVGIQAYPGSVDGEFDNIPGLIIEVGATLSAGVGTSVKVAGTVSGKETKCEEESCRKLNVGGGVNASLGGKAEAALKIKSCHAGTNHSEADCTTILAGQGGGEIKFGIGGSVNVTSKANCSAECGELSFNLGKITVSGSIGYEVTVAHLLKYKKESAFEAPIAPGFSLGPYGTCN